MNYWYYNNDTSPVLCLGCRDVRKKYHLVQVRDELLTPFFGILESDKELLYDRDGVGLWKTFSEGPNSLYGEKTLRVYTQFPWQVPKLRKLFKQTFQADVKWEKMAMSKIIKARDLDGPYIDITEDYPYDYLTIDGIGKVRKEEFFIVDQRICYWDIETSVKDLVTMEGWKDYKDCPIISITAYDNYDDIYYEFVWHPDFIKDEESNIKNYDIGEHKVREIQRYEFVLEKDMLRAFAEWFGSKKFDRRMGYFSEGGFRKQSFKGSSSRKWVDGYDMPMFFKRAEYLGLIEDIQKMSPTPLKKSDGRYLGVYMRSTGGKNQVYTAGTSAMDFVFTREVLQFDQKYSDFRGHKLNDWMLFFLGYGKLDKDIYHVWEYWLQKDIDGEELAHKGFMVNGVPRIKDKGLEYMLDYNLIDVKGVYELDKKFDVAKSQFGRSEVSVSPFEDGIYGSKLHDHAKLTYYQDDYAFDSKYQGFVREEINGKNQIGDKFTLTLKDLEDKARASGKDVEYKTLKDIGKIGGYVPKIIGRGIYKWVAVIDFSKFYPNAIKSSNAGIETAVDIDKEEEHLVRGYIIDNKIGRRLVEIPRADLIETPVSYFRKDIKSLNAKTFDMWLAIRKEAQDRLKDYLNVHKTTKTDRYNLLWTDQFNKKNFTNIGFGVFGLPIDRTYSKLIFNSCTCMCQDISKFVLSELRQAEIRVVGGDTDSAFVQLQADNLHDAVAEGKGICAYLNEKIDEYLNNIYNIQNNTINIGLETISDKFYVDTMKHYVKRNLWSDGVILDEPEFEIKGMDLKKRATSQLAADVQRKLIEIMFGDDDPVPKMIVYLSNINTNLRDMNWSYVCKRGALNKPLDKYSAGHQSARGARNSQKYLDKQYLPGSNPFLGVFKEMPEQLNGKFISVKGNFILSFDAEDIPELMEAGFELNYDRIIETELFKKTEHMLGVFGEDYYSIVESNEEGDFMDT